MTRILTALVGIPIVVTLTWLGGWAFVAMVAVLALAGQREAFGLFAGDGKRPGNLAAALCALAMVFAPAWSPAAWLIGPLGIASLVWFLIVAPAGQPLKTQAGALFGLIYPSAFLVGLVLLRLPLEEQSWDPFVVTMGVVLLVWTADTAAYYAGRTFGRHKLAPALSPGKTWEGVIGGAVGALVIALVLSQWWSGDLAVQHWIVLSVITASVGPTGDLFESALKRAAGVKDSAGILPGHGGVLDRFDALLFVAPIAAAYLYAIV